MPTLTRWLLRAALVHLALALALGVVMALPGSTRSASLRPVYVHLLVAGWATQMIFGVAYWMFPRPGPDHAYGSTTLGWAAFAGLNVGLVLRAVAEPALAMRATPVMSALLVVSAALQLAAALGFVALVWRRVIAR